MAVPTKRHGIYSGGAANLLHMANLQHGVFNLVQAKFRGVSKKTLEDMEADGLIEDMGMGYYALTDRAKGF